MSDQHWTEDSICNCYDVPYTHNRGTCHPHDFPAGTIVEAPSLKEATRYESLAENINRKLWDTTSISWNAYSDFYPPEDDNDAAFYENQLAQRAVWAAEDYKRYQKAKFFLLNGSPYSVHVPKNRDIVEFLEQHYPNFKEEGE